MENIDKEHQARKAAITFADGHTEEYDTFIALVATGLTPVAKEDDTIIYMAEEGKLQTRGIAHVAASSEVIAALINTLLETLRSMLSHAGPREALDIMGAILSMEAIVTEDYTQLRRKDVKPGEN